MWAAGPINLLLGRGCSSSGSRDRKSMAYQWPCALPAITCSGSGCGWRREVAAGRTLSEFSVLDILQLPCFSQCRCQLVLEIMTPAACHRVLAVFVMTGQMQPWVSVSWGDGGLKQTDFICLCADNCQQFNFLYIFFFFEALQRFYFWFLSFLILFFIILYFSVFSFHTAPANVSCV